MRRVTESLPMSEVREACRVMNSFLTLLIETCGYCHYCRKGTELFCEHFNPAGVARDGGFADYIK